MENLKKHKEFIMKTSIVFGIAICSLIILEIAEEILDFLFDFIGF